MKRGQVLAAAFLALGFAVVSGILVFIEPGMGFAHAADFFDPAKVLRGAASLAWAVGEGIYVGLGLAFGYRAMQSDDRYLQSSGLVAGTLFSSSVTSVACWLPGLVSLRTQSNWRPRYWDSSPFV